MPKMIEDYQHGMVVAESFSLKFQDTTVDSLTQAIHETLDCLGYRTEKDKSDTGLVCYAADKQTVLEIQPVLLAREWVRSMDNARRYPRFHLIIQPMDLYPSCDYRGLTVKVNFHIHSDYMQHHTSRSEAGLEKVRLEANRIKSCVAQFLQPVTFRFRSRK